MSFINNELDNNSPLLESMNPQQLEAVCYGGKSLLILAGAGSGKTRVLTHRIAYLLDRKLAFPSQILAITFTNKAAAEMRERVQQLIGISASGMWISTFHSICVKILRQEAENLGYNKNFTIYDSGDTRALLKRLIKEKNFTYLGLGASGVAARISNYKNELIDASDISSQLNLADPKERAFLELYRSYSQEISKANAFDFDDLIANVVYLFRAHPEVALRYKRRFRYILVDEYQDTNQAQYALIRELTRGADAQLLANSDLEFWSDALNENGDLLPASLCVVGDSDQSIYAFRGANIRNIIEFESDYPDAHVILLEQNYRSTQNILSAANAVIANNFDRKAKNLWTDSGDGEKITGYTAYTAHDEARFIADEISKRHNNGLDYKNIAVFYRTNSQTRSIEEIFIREAIPYRVIGGTKFYDRAEIKDAISYLISIINPSDENALRRIINTPKRGIGPRTISHIAGYAQQEGISFRQALQSASDLELGPKITREIKKLDAILLTASQDAQQAIILASENENIDDISFEYQTQNSAVFLEKNEKVGSILEYLLKESGYIEFLENSKDAQDGARLENLQELISVAREFDMQYPGGSVVDFLTEVALVSAADDLEDKSGTVSLMTLHTAKGLEYNTVFITGVEEGLIPHQMSFDEVGGPNEERRLFYVGITRARKKLYLSLSLSRNQFGENTVALPSRFLQEIPEDLIDWVVSPNDLNSRGGSYSRALNYRGLESRARSNTSWGANSTATWGSGSTSGSANSTESNYYEAANQGKNMRSSLDKWRNAKKEKAKFSNTIVDAVISSNDLDLIIGETVWHKNYGKGVVAQIVGSGAKQVATIDFDEHGTKKIVVALAPLSKTEN